MIYQHEVEERRARASYDPGDRVMPEFAGPEYYEDQDEYLRSRGLSPKLARANGWYPTQDTRVYVKGSQVSGDTELRIVMPCSPAALNHWQARLIARDASPETKRYQSSYGPRGAAIIIAYPQYIEQCVLAIVEGPMDALAAAETGIIGVALMGNSPAAAALDLIAHTFERYESIVVPDRDALGAAAKTMAALSARGLPSRMQMLAHKDLAEVPAAKRTKALGL